MTSDQQPRQDVRERVVEGILAAAARAIARDGDSASMIEVAREAGIARATLYRYFGSRSALEDAVVERGVTRGSAAMRAARLGEVPVGEGVARAVRALLELEEALVVIIRRRASGAAHDFDAHVAGPLRRLLHDGQRDGRIRGDVPIAWLTDSLVNLAAGAGAALRPRWAARTWSRPCPASSWRARPPARRRPRRAPLGPPEPEGNDDRAGSVRARHGGGGRPRPDPP